VDKMLSKVESHQDWPVQSPISTTFITTSNLVKFATCGHEHTVERKMAISFDNQPCHSGESHYPSARLWSSSLFEVFVEPLPHRTGSLQSLSVQMGTDTVTALLVEWVLDHEPHCGLLHADQIWRWTNDSTCCWRRCCQLDEFCGDYSTREIIIFIFHNRLP